MHSCAAGEFGESGPACGKCSAGRYRESDASSALACEACPRILPGLMGQAACLPCVPGKYQDRLRYVLQAVCSQPFCQRDRDDQMPCLVTGTVAKGIGSATCQACIAGTFGSPVDMPWSIPDRDDEDLTMQSWPAVSISLRTGRPTAWAARQASMPVARRHPNAYAVLRVQ